MKLKSILLAAMLASSFGSAYAGSFNGVPNGDIQLVNNNPAVPTFYTAGFNHEPVNDLTGGFTDIFTFLPAVTNGSLASAALTNMSLSGIGALEFTSITLNGVSFVDQGGGDWKLTAIPVLAGPLTLMITGKVVSGGSYGGNLNVLLAPVPEPETYAMMLGGLGLIGFMARRRKRG